jgi:hypothetical protein
MPVQIESGDCSIVCDRLHHVQRIPYAFWETKLSSSRLLEPLKDFICLRHFGITGIVPGLMTWKEEQDEHETTQRWHKTKAQNASSANRLQ